MKKTNLFLQSLLHGAGVIVYVFLVALIMRNGQYWFGDKEPYIGMVAFLLLFVVSASVVSLLVFARPFMLYFDNKKKEAVMMACGTVGAVVLYTIIIFVILFFLS